MNLTPTTLSRLLEQARNGDGESQGALLRHYFRYLRMLSQGHLDERVRMRVSASDVVQETLLEAHRDFAKFAGTSLQEFTGWLRKILFNNLARAVENHLLAAKRDVRRQQSLDEKIKDASHSAARWEGVLRDRIPSASSIVRRDESLDQLSIAINSLPEDYRQVIQLRHFEGLSFQQIAVRLQRNEGAARMLWFRAVEKLKSELSRPE
jgi:RNA polymerase sigma-70 factor, ECF subfamily